MKRAGKYYFDKAAADRVCRFFETQLRHWKGKWAGQLFTLLPWERKALRDLFGWQRTVDGTRRYRTAYIEVARKNGKTLFVSGILLYLLCADGEQGAEVYAAACTADQSGVAFRDCRSMVYASPLLKKRLQVKQYTIEDPLTNSVLKALSGESVGSHGKNASGISIDELHEGKGKSFADLYEALVTSVGARMQPLIVQITTAGNASEDTICRQQHVKAVKYLTDAIGPDDPEYDDTFYPVIYAAGRDDDWTSPKTWAKANPSLGITPTREFLQRECIKAKESPANENSFRRLYLNQWTEQTTRWLSMDAYDAAVESIDVSELFDAPCYVGTDLSSHYDVTATVALYKRPDRWFLVPTFYLPRETAVKRQRDEGIRFMDWADQGYIELTDSKTIDERRIEADIRELAAASTVVEVGFDKYNAVALMTRLDDGGIATVEVAQNFLGMSAACKEFERRLVDQSIVIADNPVLRWMAQNVEVEQDRHGNIRPVKPNRKGQYKGTGSFSIDGIVAAIVAISRAMLRDDAEPEDFNVEQLVRFI